MHAWSGHPPDPSHRSGGGGASGPPCPLTQHPFPAPWICNSRRRKQAKALGPRAPSGALPSTFQNFGVGSFAINVLPCRGMHWRCCLSAATRENLCPNQQNHGICGQKRLPCGPSEGHPEVQPTCSCPWASQQTLGALTSSIPIAQTLISLHFRDVPFLGLSV